MRALSRHRRRRTCEPTPIIAVVCTFICVCAVLMLTWLPLVNAWERAAGYPFGKMCHSIFTAYVDTCPKEARR